MHAPAHLINFLKNRELDELYASVALRSLALGMINIFIPIYLYKINYSLSEIFLFFALGALVHVLFAFPSAKISSFYGFKHSIFFSVPFLILFYLLLASLDSFGWPLWILAFLLGVGNALFWVGYHTDFAKFSDLENRGKEVGFSQVLNFVATAGGPFIGGLILVVGGFVYLFAVAAVLLVISVIPLFWSDDPHESLSFSLRQVFYDQTLREYLGFLGHGIEVGARFIVWPLFVFVTFAASFPVLGLIFSVSWIASIMFTAVTGELSDWKRELVLRFGAFLNAVIWILKYFVASIPQVFVADFFHGFTRSAIHVPFDALTYDKANQKGNILEFVVFRETVAPLGSALFFLVMAGAANLAPIFGWGALGSFLYIFF